MNDDEQETEISAEELLATVLSLAAGAVEQQYHDETRETLWAVIDACAEAYGLSIERVEEPPKHYPFRIVDATPPRKDNGETQ